MKGSISPNSILLKFRNNSSTQASSADLNSVYQSSNPLQNKLYEEVKSKLARAYRQKPEESFNSFFSTYENMMSKIKTTKLWFFSSNLSFFKSTESGVMNFDVKSADSGEEKFHKNS